jgi:hypothetical protein
MFEYAIPVVVWFETRSEEQLLLRYPVSMELRRTRMPWEDSLVSNEDIDRTSTSYMSYSYTVDRTSLPARGSTSFDL